MKTGLIIGKFMPVHSGHLSLVNFGLKHCDKLIVAFKPDPSEPINGDLRYKWLKEQLGHDKRIDLDYIKDDLPDSRESSRSVSRHWASYLKKRYRGLDIIFSSEKYGDYIAEYANIKHVPFDPPRKKTPVSATKIRRDPFRYWKYIPENVRPYFVKKVCVFGPESTGKTTLASDLAAHFNTTWVPEMARDVLGDRHCVYEDIETIAKTQEKEIIERSARANRVLICDTDHITTKIYSQYYFQKVPAIVDRLVEKINYDLYLLLDIDVPWVPDPQRDAGHKREYFLNVFKRELEDRNIKYHLIRGDWQKRKANAVKHINNLMKGG